MMTASRCPAEHGGYRCVSLHRHTGEHFYYGRLTDGRTGFYEWPTTDPLSSRTRERGGRAQTPASPSLGEDGGDAGTNAPTETGAGGG